MKKPKNIIFILSLLALVSCNKVNSTSTSNSNGSTSSSTNTSSYTNNVSSFSKTDRLDILSDYDSQVEEDLSSFSNIIDVSTFSDGEIKTIEDSGTYILTGSSDNGRIVIDSKSDIVLILNNVNLKSLTDAPLEIKGASSLTIYVASKTKNYLTDTSSNTLEATLLCKKVSLNIEGDGYFYIESNGLEDNDSGVGIQAAKGLNINNSHIIVSSTSHSLNSKAGIEGNNCKLYLTSKKDGIHSKEGGVSLTTSTIDADTYGDGIDAALEVTLDNVTSHFTSTGTYVLYDASLDTDNSIYEDSKYILENGEYKKISSDDMTKYKTRYYLEQKCKGVKSELAVSFNGGNHYFYTADDCIASDTEIDITSGDYIFYTLDQAINSDQVLNIGKDDENIDNLSISIYHSYEGIQGGNIHFYDGEVVIYSEDDGINATSDTLASVSMNFYTNSTVYVFASGDGIDSNGDITMSGGNLFIFGPTSNDNSAIDYDGKFTYSDGLLLAVGSSNMAETPSSDNANIISYTASNWNNGDICSFSVNSLNISFILMKNYSNMNVILANGNKIETGKDINIYKNLSFGSDISFNNYVYVGDINTDNIESTTSSTVSSGVTKIGSNSQIGGMDGGNNRPGNEPGRRP